MIALFSMIADTFWEFWQYLKPKGKVYLAGKYYNDRLILIRMIPEQLPMGNGWEQLTEVMDRKDADKRAMMFPLYRVVAPKESPEIGT